MKRVATILALIVILSLGLPVSAQGPDGERAVYIVLMADTPAVAYEGGVPGIAATKPGEGGKIDVNSAQVQQYRQLLADRHGEALRSAGVDEGARIYDYTVALNGFAAVMSEAEAKRLAKQPGVVSVRRDELKQLTTDASPSFLGLNASGGPWTRGITGENVIVGVIDSGIWPEHPSFADDGSFSPAPVGIDECNFGNTAHNPNDAPFTCNNKLIGARQFLDSYKLFVGLDASEFDSARDDDGHGTHTASTAAGNRNVPASIFGISRGRISGIAPRARVVAYRACALLGCFTSDTAGAIDQAVADGVDVINYSIGGGADLLTSDSVAFLFAADAGVYVATSAGNSGPEAGTVGSPAVAPWITAVGANTHDRGFISEITLSGPGQPPGGLWGESVTRGIQGYRLVDAEGIEDSEGDDSGQCLNPFPAGTFQAKDAVLCNQYDFGVARTQRVANVAAGGGGAVVFHNSPAVNITPTDNHPLPTVHVLNEVGDPLKEYLVANPGQVNISFTRGIARNASTDPRVKPYVLTSFSSRGPDVAALDIIKPDVTAPGFSILAGASPIHITSAAQGELFQAIMGTSMSSPHVAGMFALIKQAHPDWSAAEAKSALMTSAFQGVLREDGVTPAGPFDVGAGHINPGQLKLAGASGGTAGQSSAFDPGLVYDAGLLDYFGFICGVAPEAFGDAGETCAFLAGLGISTDASDLNLASLGVAELTGSQTVIRTVTSVAEGNEWREYNVAVDAPPGFEVDVSPSTLNLRQGDTATYAVTITNEGADSEEWSFGSLTWQDSAGRYAVYTPLAVRASLFDAPLEVSGTGVEGSLSFEIKFGYSGDYEAKPHGLVAATLTQDNVLQDEDQTFDPGDVESGGANLHEFELSGAAAFRVAIPPEATEEGADLDVYVYDPDGNLAGSSTNADTDEVVTIVQPADGAWQVYVHGWSTPGGDSDYTLYSWVVPLETGGSLEILSAPDSATSGETGTVEIGWSGLDADTQYLGAVSHNGPDGIMGLTLVNVDTRQ